jgi:hypothetical protein
MNVSFSVRTSVRVALLLLVACRSTALAQVLQPGEWRQGTALAGFAGATTSSGTGGATGASIGWELLPHLTIEGSGVWTTRVHGVDAFAALIGVRVNVTGPGTVVPFVSAGVGFHRATVETSNANLPSFYRARLGPLAGPQTHATFDDVVSAAGAGVDIYVRRHLALRPDVRLLFVRGGAATRTAGVFGLHLAYHFEEHVTTP